MDTKQATCPHCNQPTLRTVGQSVDCTNRDCRAYMLTMEPGRFMALTAADFAAFEAGHNQAMLAQIDVEQELFELKMARLQRDLAARQAARGAGERVYG